MLECLLCVSDEMLPRLNPGNVRGSRLHCGKTPSSIVTGDIQNAASCEKDCRYKGPEASSFAGDCCSSPLIVKAGNKSLACGSPNRRQH
jgi:hypothetical protein